MPIHSPFIFGLCSMLVQPSLILALNSVLIPHIASFPEPFIAGRAAAESAIAGRAALKGIIPSVLAVGAVSCARTCTAATRVHVRHLARELAHADYPICGRNSTSSRLVPLTLRKLNGEELTLMGSQESCGDSICCNLKE
eukprot:4150645-Amphidinium_carterae.1